MQDIQDTCERCLGRRVVSEPENRRTKCTICGAYVYDWVVQAEMLRKLSGERIPGECVRQPVFAPPEIGDISKNDLADLVWRLAERLSEEPTTKRTLQTIVDEYVSQRKADPKKTGLSKRLRRLLETL